MVEGNSIRSTERMTDTHRDTIMRLMVEVGNGCTALANDQMRNLDCRRIQCDETGGSRNTPYQQIGSGKAFEIRDEVLPMLRHLNET
ncbi:MAG: hypothetical protein ABSC37_02875 [Xanthobacteraceae bacterium]